MDTNCQNPENNSNPEFLLSQLNTARREINNLRQQLKSLQYIHKKDLKEVLEVLENYESKGDSFVKNENEMTNSSSGTENDELKLKPIGVISTWFPNKRGVPRQPGICEKAPGKITLFNTTFTNPEHALEGLDGFSHMWILFHFHRNASTHVRAKVSPPRLNGERTGVFSTRSPHRPCPIGLSLVRIVRIENNAIYFEGVDMVDQTPVLDIKPYVPQYDNPLHRQPELNQRLEDDDSDVAREFLEELGEEAAAIDVSGDEELALREQVAEFGGSLELVTNFRHLNVSGEDQVGLDMENQVPRNSRLLDGADGQSSDLDLVQRRRSLSSRVDNSPIRMGVREAPDGEEELDSQSLTPSQTLAVLDNNASNVNLDSSVRLNNGGGQGNNDSGEVRVPHWISHPHTATLSVVFNERALAQLREILKDKVDEQKQVIENVLREDPRSVYLRQRWGNQFYTFLIQDLHISCRFDDVRGIVTVFQVRHAGRTCQCGEPEWQCLGHSNLP